MTSSNPQPDHPQQDDDPQKIQQRVEFSISKRFAERFSKKVDLIQQRFAQNPQDFQLQEEEKKILLRINNSGLLEGFAAGVVSLILLRRMRAALLKRVQKAVHKDGTSNHSDSPMNQMLQQRQQQGQQQGHHIQQQTPPQFNNPFHNNNSSHNNTGNATFNSAFQQQQQQQQQQYQPGLFMTMFGWTMDLMVSFVAAATVSVSLLDLDRILNDLSKIPLLPGQSTVSREFCPDAEQILQELRQEAKTQPAIQRAVQEPQINNLQALLRFARNCGHRRCYEEQLRKEKGVSAAYRVSIPQPGVPVPSEHGGNGFGMAMGEEEEELHLFDAASSSSSSSWIDDDNSTFMTDAETKNDDSNNNSWADGLVQDQQDNGRRS